ncbi:hypothetical protein TNCV_868591 [Trichonephila clavipes]|nr:hypothetical protein TNCV_868591 [Trichonephila clavipes]
MLGRQIAALSHPPSSVTELKRALQETWNRLSPQLIHHLIASMVLFAKYVLSKSLIAKRIMFAKLPTCTSSNPGDLVISPVRRTGIPASIVYSTLAVHFAKWLGILSQISM